MLLNYDFKEVLISWNGQILTGYADGDDAVQVEADTDAWTKQIGADGEVTRSKSNNNGGKITLKFQQGSPSNDILMASYIADQSGGAGKGAMFIKDTLGRSLHTIAEGWVSKLPNASYGTNSGSREWVIETGNLVSNIGGN